MRISRLLTNQNFIRTPFGNKIKPAKGTNKDPENETAVIEAAIFQVNSSAYSNSSKIKSSAREWPITGNELNKIIQAINATFETPSWTQSYRSKELNNYFGRSYSLDTLAFFAHCLKINPENSSDLNLLKYFQVLSSNCNKEEVNEITRSGFLRWLISENKDCAKKLFDCEFKSLFSDIKSLKKLNEYFKDDLLKDFIQKDISENKDSILSYDFEGKYIDLLFEKLDPVAKFSELQESKVFYPLLKERNTKDIIELIKIIQNRILKKSSNKKTKELYNAIAPLLKAKTPAGDFLFTTSIQSDTGQKNMLSGIENFLDSKTNDPEQYKKLLNWLNLTTKGVIPGYILGVLPRNAQINPEVDSEITKSLTGSKIQTFSDKNKALALTQPKDVVKIKNKLYYRNSISLIPLKLSEEYFNKLFSAIDSLATSQGENGNCYFVCAIYNLMQNPDTRGLIYQMFEQKENGEVVITFETLKGIQFIYNLDEFSTDERNINASLGIKLLEDSYAKAMEVKYSRNDSGLDILSYGQEAYVYNSLIKDCSVYEFYISKNDSESPVEHNATKEYLKEKNGFFEEEIGQLQYTLSRNSLFQGGFSKKQTEELQEKIRLYEAEILANQKIIFELDKIKAKQIKKEDLRSLIASLINQKGVMLSTGSTTDGDKDRLINANHAYTISEFDNKTGLIKLINPWNTAFSVTLTFEEFENWFDGLTVLDLYKTVN